MIAILILPSQDVSVTMRANIFLVKFTNVRRAVLEDHMEEVLVIAREPICFAIGYCMRREDGISIRTVSSSNP